MTHRLLDLFCGAGGCSVGYARAGFEVVGVDNRPQPHYPYEFHQADALDFLIVNWQSYDAIHASPPCQAYTTMSNRARGNHPDLLGPTLEMLDDIPRLWIVENVPGAATRMVGYYTITLHGGMFGLGVQRPRIFASNTALLTAPAGPVVNPIGVYGREPDGRRLFTRADGTEQRAASSLEEGAAAMGIDWMTDWRDLAEAIPPLYTEYVGAQLIAHLDAERAA